MLIPHRPPPSFLPSLLLLPPSLHLIRSLLPPSLHLHVSCVTGMRLLVLSTSLEVFAFTQPQLQVSLQILERGVLHQGPFSWTLLASLSAAAPAAATTRKAAAQL